MPAQVQASMSHTDSSNNKTDGTTNPPIDKEKALFAQINLNSKVSGSKRTKFTNINVTKRHQHKTPDKILGSLLQPGKAGGKFERSRQILKVIHKNNRVTVDEKDRKKFLDQQDTSKGIIDFLNALQINTKQLPKLSLKFVEILALPRILLANTYVRQTSSRIQNRTAYGETPSKNFKLDNEAPSSWLTP